MGYYSSALFDKFGISPEDYVDESSLTQEDLEGFSEVSVLRSFFIEAGLKPGRDSFDSLSDYVRYWNDYLYAIYDDPTSNKSFLGFVDRYSEEFWPFFNDYQWWELQPWVVQLNSVSVGVKIPFTLLFSSFGIISNIVVIVVFCRLGILSDSCTTILTAISISDFLYCLLMFVAYCLHAPLYYLLDETIYGDISSDLNEVYRVLIGVKYIFVEFNCWATTYLALERMISVMFPFHVKRYFNARRSRWVVAAIFVVCFVLQFHSFLRYKLEWRYNFVGDAYLQIVETGWISGKVSVIGSLINVITRAVAVILVVVFNAIIIVKIKTAQKRMGRSMTAISSAATGSEARSSRNIRLTRVMTVVSLIFLLCYTPLVVKETLVLIDYQAHLMEASFIKVVVPILELSNSCFNIFLYYALSSKFKEKLKQMCKCTG